jgi:2-iminobutanoate/2-iminopropanoate deaminase
LKRNGFNSVSVQTYKKIITSLYILYFCTDKNLIMKRIIYTENAPKAVGPYSQAVENGNTLYISGQVAIDPSTGKMIEGDVQKQTGQVLKNIGAILEAAGYTYSDVVKSTCLLHDIKDFQAMNEIYGRYYKECPPARAAYGGLDLPLGAMVEIETVAVKG